MRTPVLGVLIHVMGKKFSLHRKNSKVGEAKKNLSYNPCCYRKIRWFQRAQKWCLEADKRIWKTVKSQGKVREF